MIDSLKIYLLDILSILLPGCLLIVVLHHFNYLPPSLTGIFQKSGIEWINLLVLGGVGYVAGHFVFLIGSLLDNWIFENVKRVFWNDHKLTAYLIRYKDETTGITDRFVFNAFKWSCAWLMANKPEMYATVERHIAESKFFRSLVVVFFILLFVFLRVEIKLAGISFLLISLALIRYLTQRQKSIETAYQFIITTSAKKFETLDQNTLDRLNARNIYPSNPNPATGFGKLWCWLKKVGIVLNLCLNPFKKSAITTSTGERYFTREIRWFFNHDNETIAAWFSKLGTAIAKQESRTDFYMPIPDKPDMSIKLRDSNIEIKQRIKIDATHRETGNLNGSFEEWEKWSFHLHDPDPLAKRIISEKKYNWVEVHKERIGIKVTIDNNDIKLLAINAQPTAGCQIEYTKILINKKEYFTFAIEWFGEPKVELPAGFIEKIVGSTVLHTQQSMGYNEFLNNPEKIEIR